ncbi:uncharacterized protein MONBRDRAFT_39389, partial [Monosiga brevicollis MX1]
MDAALQALRRQSGSGDQDDIKQSAQVLLEQYDLEVQQRVEAIKTEIEAQKRSFSSRINPLALKITKALQHLGAAVQGPICGQHSHGAAQTPLSHPLSGPASHHDVCAAIASAGLTWHLATQKIEKQQTVELREIRHSADLSVQANFASPGELRKEYEQELRNEQRRRAAEAAEEEAQSLALIHQLT